MTTGIHHVTLITRKVQANVDFYVGFLGLSLVKRTGGFEDSEQLHLFYGDAAGSPGSIITFLVWEDGARGRVGVGQVGEVAFAVPKDTIGDWLTRAMAAQVPVEGPSREFDEPVLRQKDPDGTIVKLVGIDVPAGTPLRLRSVTLLTEEAEKTAAFVERFGYRPGPREGNTLRMLSDTDAVDVRDATGYFPGIPGTGTFDHVAFRAADADAVRAMRLSLGKAEGLTNVHDRKYFLSLYVREPGGILFEHATDAPGFTVDEPADKLGQTLFIPPHDAARAEDLRVMLPQFALPGEERWPTRHLPFVHRFYEPEVPDGSVILLLHGSGGTEASLMPMAHRINPRATLLGVRGRATEEGIARWFRRHGAGRFDQSDIRAEAEAFAAFVDGAVRGYGLDPGRLTVLGESNGANFAAAVMALYTGLIRRAILLRATPVLEELPEVDLSGTRILALDGADDPYAATTPALTDWLKRSGAEVEAHKLKAGHDTVPEDITLARAWI